jgi:putative ABC transport system permease protein
MALGVMLVVAVLLIHGVIAESFRSNASLGYNLIMGAKGGKLQLVLNTVFYLSEPVENIPYSFYLEFLAADQRPDGQDGRWKNYVDRVIPVCLGDYYRDFRVVGTIPAMFDHYVYDEDTGAEYTFAEGRNFEHYNRQHGYFEAIVGARVAREAGLKVGDTIAATHGSSEGSAHEDLFHLVGILAPSGTPNDRAVFVNMEGFYLLEGHAKPVANSGPSAADSAAAATSTAATEGAAASKSESEHEHDYEHDYEHEHESGREHQEPLPIEQREVTALLVKTSPIITRGLSNMINEGSVAQAVFPVGEITTLFNRIVQPFQRVLLALTAMICVVSGISILVSIYNSMNDRRREIAIMRSLGAGRRTVMAIVLLEAIILAVGGGVIGWAAGHLLIASANPWIEAETGVSIGPLDTAPPINLVEYLSSSSSLEIYVSTEWILVPSLIVLAVIVGFWPALAAYRTDVAQALTANP